MRFAKSFYDLFHMLTAPEPACQACLLGGWSAAVRSQPSSPEQDVDCCSTSRDCVSPCGQGSSLQMNLSSFEDTAAAWLLVAPDSPEGFSNVWRALAKGIAIGVSGREDYSAVLMSFHPRGGGTSSRNFHDDEWLDFNMQQTGHGLADQVQPWAKIMADYDRKPVKPVVDGEPLYEDHPLAFRAKDNGYSFDAHVRQRAYWDVFSGTAGHTYGDHSVWQMYAPGRKPVTVRYLTGTKLSIDPVPPKCNMFAASWSRGRISRVCPTTR